MYHSENPYCPNCPEDDKEMEYISSIDSSEIKDEYRRNLYQCKYCKTVAIQ